MKLCAVALACPFGHFCCHSKLHLFNWDCENGCTDRSENIWIDLLEEERACIEIEVEEDDSQGS